MNGSPEEQDESLTYLSVQMYIFINAVGNAFGMFLNVSMHDRLYNKTVQM